MARKKTSFSYESQAKLSLILAVVSGVGLLATVYLLSRNFTDFQTFWVNYNPTSMYLPALGACLVLALVCGGVGCLVGFNSAGQRRNTQSGLGWLGFFVNAGLITLAMCLGIFFYLARHAVAA